MTWLCLQCEFIRDPLAGPPVCLSDRRSFWFSACLSPVEALSGFLACARLWRGRAGLSNL